MRNSMNNTVYKSVYQSCFLQLDPFFRAHTLLHTVQVTFQHYCDGGAMLL